MRDGKAVSLPPKAFDTLLILVRGKGTLVSKEDLLQELWPDSFVEENNLNQYISTLRKALGDNGNGSKYIETIPRLGYRFAAEVRESTVRPLSFAGTGRALETSLTKPSLVKPSLITVVVAASILISLIVIASYRSGWNPGETPPVSAGTRTLAVLPLRNLKPDPENDFLSIALADAITSRLGYVGEINVEPLSWVAKYRNTDADARQIARELDVQNVLTGSYLKEGNDLRVTLEFTSLNKKDDRWRESLELKYDKLFTVQDRVAMRVFRLMGVELQPEEVERLNKGAPTNAAAYEFYLRGIDEAFERYDHAAALLEKSVALEPGNAMAWTELGSAYLGYAEIQGGDSTNLEKGWQAFHHAMELDPGNRFIVDQTAFHLLEHSEVDEALPLLQQSIRSNPNDSFAHWYLSEAYRYGGALDKSPAEGELALRLNPNVAQNTTFNTYLYVGQYQRFLNSQPRGEKSARTVFYRGLAYYHLKDARKAAEEFDLAFALNPALLHSQIGRALTYALRNQNAQGLELMRRIEASGRDDGEMLYKMSQAYAQLGDRKGSVRLLRRSVELNFYPYTYFLHDPLLEPIRGEAEYREVTDLARRRQESFLRRFF